MLVVSPSPRLPVTPSPNRPVAASLRLFILLLFLSVTMPAA
jgi:hypothetical protein